MAASRSLLCCCMGHFVHTLIFMVFNEMRIRRKRTSGSMESVLPNRFPYLKTITRSHHRRCFRSRRAPLVSTGIGAKERVLVVVYSYRGADIRIISARVAEPHERSDDESEQ
jgi:hypothetical protein